MGPTELLDGSHQLLVLIHVLHINMLLLSSLGTYTCLERESEVTFTTDLGGIVETSSELGSSI